MLNSGGGSVVNVGAAIAQSGKKNMSAYILAKNSVARLTEGMAAELADKGVRVNCVLPSIIDTPENRKSMPDSDFEKWVSLGSLADVMLFLASDAARSVHGACLPVVGLVET
jgi:NAD(P)-dependent dehydrogenase (short-subunit alcohol dehydrogenase family)